MGQVMVLYSPVWTNTGSSLILLLSICFVSLRLSIKESTLRNVSNGSVIYNEIHMNIPCTDVPTKSDSDVIFGLQLISMK